MTKTFVLCGDSFNYGVGCTNMHTQPYGVLVAKHFGWDLIRLARGSSSNYVTSLQGRYAAKMNPKPHLVLLGTTSYDRIEWVETGKALTPGEVKFENVNYHLYPAHHETPPCHDAPMPFHLQGNPNYDPKILSEQVVGITDYIKWLSQGNKMGYYKRMHQESLEKLKLIETYYMDIFDFNIKRDYDTGAIMLAYIQLKKLGIPTLIFGSDTRFREFVFEERDYYYQDWGRCTQLWPDTVNSMHTSEEGHADTAAQLIQHLEKHNFA
jgi:hypothetical protein